MSPTHTAVADEIAARNRLTVIGEYTGAARGLDALMGGRPDEAFSLLADVDARVERTGRRLPGRPAVGGGPARGHGPSRAARGGARPARRAGAPGGGDLARLGRCGRGRIAGLLADDHRPRFVEALRRHETATAPFEAARTRLCFGQRLRRDGARIEAREQLRAAADGFRAIGAAPWVKAAERELGATGERLRRRALDAPEELTTQEREIADLVAAGASNKDVAAELYLSPKTVEAHLTRVYRKLGVNSRTQLARRLEEERSATAN